MVNAVTWGALRGHVWSELGPWENLLNADVPDPDPPADPDFGPPVWYICDLKTGNKLHRLPEVRCKISDVIGQYSSSTATIPIPTDTLDPCHLTQHQVEDLFHPWRRMLIRVAAGVPMWGGIITGRKGGSEATLSVSVTTIPVYLDMRIVQDHDFVQADESTIVASLVADANVEGIGILVDAPPTGLKHDRTYRRKDGATVYKRLSELADVDGGAEWHIFLREKPDETGFVIVLELRPEIGVTEGTGLPVFTARPTYGSTTTTEATYTLTESYSREDFANYVVAVGDGQGDAQPESVPARSAALDAGEEPRIERRYSPGSSITNVSTLNAHARAEIERDQAGAQLWEITARADVTPIYGRDWRIGQTIRAQLTGHRHPPDPDYPNRPGVIIERRVMGWDLSEDGTMITPKW